jgi:hypothetical protein
MSYHLTLQEQPSYLHATVTGANSADNALRFLREVHEACARLGRSSVLLEVNFSGPSLETGSIFRVISERSKDGAKLHRIAYVDGSTRDPERMKFAETVAINRGVNVRLFQDVEAAKRWIADDSGHDRT